VRGGKVSERLVGGAFGGDGTTSKISSLKNINISGSRVGETELREKLRVVLVVNLLVILRGRIERAKKSEVKGSKNEGDGGRERKKEWKKNSGGTKKGDEKSKTKKTILKKEGEELNLTDGEEQKGSRGGPVDTPRRSHDEGS